MKKKKKAFQSMKNYRTFKSRLRKEIKIQIAKSMDRTHIVALPRPNNVNSDKASENLSKRLFLPTFK